MELNTAAYVSEDDVPSNPVRDIEEIYRYWNEVIKPTNDNDKLGAIKLYRGLQKEGWKKSMIMEAIFNYSKSEWHVKTGNRKRIKSFLKTDMLKTWLYDRAPVKSELQKMFGV